MLYFILGIFSVFIIVNYIIVCGYKKGDKPGYNTGRARNTIKIVSSEAPKPTVKPAMLIEVEELEGRDVMAATPPAPEHSNTKWLQRSIRTNDALDHPNFLRQERTFVEAFEPRPPTPQYRDTSPDSATYGDDHSVHILRPFTEPAFEFVPQVKTSTTLATTLNF